MQNHYSLIYREEEREMMPTLKVGDELPFGATCRTRSHRALLFVFPHILIPSTLALAPSRGPRSHAALSHAPWENVPSALITICA